MNNEGDDKIKIGILQEQMKTVQDQIQAVDKRVGEVDKKIDDRFDKIEGLMRAGFEKADTKYANKWVEDGIKWAVGVILGAVILAILGLVLVKGGGGV